MCGGLRVIYVLKFKWQKYWIKVFKIVSSLLDWCTDYVLCLLWDRREIWFTKVIVFRQNVTQYIWFWTTFCSNTLRYYLFFLAMLILITLFRFELRWITFESLMALLQPDKFCVLVPLNNQSLYPSIYYLNFKTDNILIDFIIHFYVLH